MKHLTNYRRLAAPLLALGLALGAGSVQAQPQRVVIVGDSISEGVQSADAGWTTQALTYGTWVTFLMGSPDSIPYLNHSLLGIVGDPAGRNRFAPNAITDNVAVSGATLGDVLRTRANAASEAQIDDEFDLILYPRLQTQIEYAESAPPDYILCWIGNNDVLSAALSFSAFDASQLTPVAQFDQDFVELADRLKALHNNFGTRTVFANIPNVTDIGFLVDRAVAEAALGFPVALPDGSYTSVVAVLLMGIFGNDGLLDNPAYVLNPAEVAIIQDRIAVFNGIIDREAARIGMPVVDANARFADFVANPPVIAGVSLTNTFLGGLFSLDGVHPNNIAHALIANEFIQTMQNEFGTAIVEIPQPVLEYIALTDPHVDKDSDGQVGGRFGAGMLESVALLLGITGDADESFSSTPGG